MTDDSIKNGDDETKAILNEMSVEQLKAKLAEKDKEMAELNKMLTDEEKHLDACRIVYKKDIDEKDKEILHQKQMIICLKSGCVEVPNPNFDGPNQDCIPCERLIRSDAPKVATCEHRYEYKAYGRECPICSKKEAPKEVKKNGR